MDGKSKIEGQWSKIQKCLEKDLWSSYFMMYCHYCQDEDNREVHEEAA